SMPACFRAQTSLPDRWSAMKRSERLVSSGAAAPAAAMNFACLQKNSWNPPSRNQNPPRSNDSPFKTPPQATRRVPNAEVQRGTEVCTCTLTVQGVAGVCAVQSQIENYRVKAKEFARLTVVAKSLRHSRQYRKLSEMYWALALGEEPDRAQPSKANVTRNTT